MNTLYMQNAQKTYTTPKREREREATRMVQQKLNLSYGKMLNHSAHADDKI